VAREPPFRLILASASPARRDLLSRAGYPFEVVPAGIDEPSSKGFRHPRTFVQHVAWLKAQAVALGLHPASSTSLQWVLAADTVGWISGQAIGKPEDRADAHRILRTLAGTEHELWTGVCLWQRTSDVQIAWQEVSRVRMRAMTDREIDNYLAARQWQGCSGAYAILEHDDPYVQLIDGSLTNVIGLPMETLSRVLDDLAAWKTE
jgi:septum formation protein